MTRKNRASRENNCYWSADGTHLPNIQPHTKIKHKVLEDYIQRWTETLTGHGAHGVRTVTLVDGFCGGGMYRDGDQSWEGSSIRMIRKVEEGLRHVQQRKPYHELDAKYIFIDNELDHTACLELQLKDAGFEHYLESGKCEIITGSFQEHLDFCLARIRERTGYSFFFLDPFGLDITPGIVRKILELGRSEVLFNHMLSGLVRILGRRDEIIYQDFFEEFEADEYYKNLVDTEEFQYKQGYLRDQALKLFREKANARFLHTFALIKDRKSVYYYLIHASSNPTALSVMKDTTWIQNNLDYQFHYGIYGVGYRTLDALAENFTIFDINEQNLEYCVGRLNEQLMEFIYENDNTPFGQLFFSTLQENPATKQMYMDSVNHLLEDGEILVMRDGKATTSRSIQSKDIITKANYKQNILFSDYGVKPVH